MGESALLPGCMPHKVALLGPVRFQVLFHQLSGTQGASGAASREVESQTCDSPVHLTAE